MDAVFAKLMRDMQACEQTPGVSVLEHGQQVWARTVQLIEYLMTGVPPTDWRLPQWVEQYRRPLFRELAPDFIIREYTLFHDCGKPYCLATPERKFPDHAQKSAETWISVGGNEWAADLMRRDMQIHTIKADGVESFAAYEWATTLMLVGLAEIHANAQMFGGLESQSFKIKCKQIDRRGRAICKHLFGAPHA